MVRGGLIEAVGPAKDVTVPFDAEVIDGKGLTVYPGFIDLFTTVGQRAGVERSATGRGRPVDLAESPLAATPADNRRGLTPEFEAAGAIELTEAARRAAPSARVHRPPLGTRRRDRDRPERSGQLERPAPPRGDREGARRAAYPPRAAHRSRRRGHSGSSRHAQTCLRASAVAECRASRAATREPVPAGLDGRGCPPAAGDARRRVSPAARSHLDQER